MNHPNAEKPSGGGKRLSADVVRAIQIESIRLTAMNCETQVSSPADAGPVEMELSTGGRALERVGDRFTVEANVALEVGAAEDSSSEEASLVEISATFRLDYNLPEKIAASDEQLATFASMNGVFNAWPYFRELIQSALTRMALPSVTIPVFRIPSLPEGLDAEDANSGEYP